MAFNIQAAGAGISASIQDMMARRELDRRTALAEENQRQVRADAAARLALEQQKFAHEKEQDDQAHADTKELQRRQAIIDANLEAATVGVGGEMSEAGAKNASPGMLKKLPGVYEQGAMTGEEASPGVPLYAVQTVKPESTVSAGSVAQREVIAERDRQAQAGKLLEGVTDRKEATRVLMAAGYDDARIASTINTFMGPVTNDHSAIFKEYQDYLSTKPDKPLTFEAYQDVDANRKRPTSSTVINMSTPEAKSAVSAMADRLEGGAEVSFGGGNAGQQTKIAVYAEIARRAAAAKEAGVDYNINANSVMFANLKKAGGVLQTQYATNSAGVKTLNDNLDRVIKTGKDVHHTDSKWVNEYVNKFVRGATKAGELSAFETNLFTAAREYAKLASGANASVAEVSATAVKAVTDIINSAQSDEALKAAVENMRADAENIVRNQGGELSAINNTIASIGKRAEDKPKTDPAKKPTAAELIKKHTRAN